MLYESTQIFTMMDCQFIYLILFGLFNSLKNPEIGKSSVQVLIVLTTTKNVKKENIEYKRIRATVFGPQL